MSDKDWKYSLLGPRKRTEVEQVDDGANEGEIVRTIEERAIIGVPAGQLEDPDAEEISRIVAEFSGRFDQPDEENAQPASVDTGKKLSTRDENATVSHRRASMQVMADIIEQCLFIIRNFGAPF